MSRFPSQPSTPATSLPRVLNQAREQARSTGQPLIFALAKVSGYSCADIMKLSLTALAVPYFSAPIFAQIQPIFTQLNFRDCVTRAIYPLQVGEDHYFVVSDPWDDQLLQWLANRLGRYPALAWGTKSEILEGLANAQESCASCNKPDHHSYASSATIQQHPVPLISVETIERSMSPIVRFVDTAIYDAWKANASDIHFECDRQGVKVKLRLDGVLAPAAVLHDCRRAEEVVSRIKVMAQLDIAERRIPQDGRFRIGLGGRELDFRVSIMPSIFGEDVVIRLLDKAQLRDDSETISLTSLRLDDDAQLRIRRLAKKPHGMLLVTGPTGSGKTTTLYATLNEIQTGQEKIITIEDPVEYELPGILQIPVNEKKGLTFSQGLRSILRHDPDKILVGEIRDAETGQIAVQAALTGHLVFTTVHANSVFDVISRFVHMGIDLFSLMSALNGVVAQRLVRVNCPRCREPEPLGPAHMARFTASGLDLTKTSTARSRGCEHCRMTGYKGRQAIAEVLPLDDALRTLILARADVTEIKKYIASLGVRALVVRALDLVAQGLTTLEEIDRVVAYD